MKKVLARPDMFFEYEKRINKYAQEFYRYLKQNNNEKKLKKVSNSKLATLHEQYNKRYKKIYPPHGVAFFGEELSRKSQSSASNGQFPHTRRII